MVGMWEGVGDSLPYINSGGTCLVFPWILSQVRPWGCKRNKAQLPSQAQEHGVQGTGQLSQRGMERAFGASERAQAGYSVLGDRLGVSDGFLPK